MLKDASGDFEHYNVETSVQWTQQSSDVPGDQRKNRNKK